jgi:hypothetical protein
LPSTICRVCGSMPKYLFLSPFAIMPLSTNFPTVGAFSTAPQPRLMIFFEKPLGKSRKHLY